jgi:Na+-translocating ferredoxin:NAD+ oxidoreductase RnfC subunit
VKTREEIIQAVREAGVTGAGGAGFPTFFKLQASADYLIANAAECEPLAQVDKQLIAHSAPQIISGIRLAMQAIHARQGIIGIKKKYKDLINHLRNHLQGASDINICEVGNFYPAGDEHVLVYDAIGKVVPEAGIPIDVGCVVQNIETLVNIHRAVEGQPFIHKYITVIGAVQKPMTVKVPLGITYQEVIDLAGGVTVSDSFILDGGAMMGNVAEPDAPVSKRTKILLVLPYDHQLSVKRRMSRRSTELQAISACDQCFICTDFCPRHAHGHAIQPHKLILLLSSGVPLTNEQMLGALLCCECRTCNYSCPVHLLPGDIAIQVKRDLVKGGLKYPHPKQTEANPYREFRRVPIQRLIARLGLAKYDVLAPLTDTPVEFKRVILQLRQGLGMAAVPLVKAGDQVQAGSPIADVPKGALGVPVHASINGFVQEVRPDSIVIEAK